MAADEQTDVGALIASARAGSSESLGELMELYRNYLDLLARTQISTHLQGRASASDIVQETFLRACDKFPQFRGTSEGELLAWLRKILVRNLATVAEREILSQKRDAKREVSLEALAKSSENVAAVLAGAVTTPSRQAQRREVAALVADRLALLPEQYREALVLRHLEGLSFNEIAERMGKTSGAVRVLWMRALRTFGHWPGGEGLL